MPFKLNPRVTEVVQAFARHGRFTPKAALNELALAVRGQENLGRFLFPELVAGLEGEQLPTLRTVQRIFSDTQGKGESLWSLRDNPGDDGKFILDVLKWITWQTGGFIETFTRSEAEWLIAIRQTVPDLGEFPERHKVYPLEARDRRLKAYWETAMAYAYREATGRDTADLDAYLAHAPWRDEEALSWYNAGVSGGVLRPVPVPSLWFLGLHTPFTDAWPLGNKSPPLRTQPIDAGDKEWRLATYEFGEIIRLGPDALAFIAREKFRGRPKAKRTIEPAIKGQEDDDEGTPEEPREE